MQTIKFPRAIFAGSLRAAFFTQRPRSKRLLTARLLAGAALALTLGAAQSARATLYTVDWNPDSTVDGTGSGTVFGGGTGTYTTATGFNAGVTYTENWETYLGTAGATGGSVTNELGGTLGGSATGTTETISFSGNFIEPILLINFLGSPSGGYAADSFDFGANSFNLLSSHNATQSLNTMSATTATTDSADDGFGIQFLGTFGPSDPLVFTYTSDGAGGDGLESVAFTLGAVGPTVPEPASATLLALGALTLLRRRTPAK